MCRISQEVARISLYKSLFSCAALAEAPFDYAKKAMFSSRMTMIGANMLYVPFAALMLVMYDKATAKIVGQYLDQTVVK